MQVRSVRVKLLYGVLLGVATIATFFLIDEAVGSPMAEDANPAAVSESTIVCRRGPDGCQICEMQNIPTPIPRYHSPQP